MVIAMQCMYAAKIVRKEMFTNNYSFHGSLTGESLSLSQLLMLNSEQAAESSLTLRHKQDRDMPLLLYISMNIHAVTHSCNLIDTVFYLGICPER